MSRKQRQIKHKTETDKTVQELKVKIKSIKKTQARSGKPE